MAPSTPRSGVKRALAGLVALAAALTLSAGSALGDVERRPTKMEIEKRTRTAVVLSRARLVKLRVVAPNRLYSLIVKVADPAAYLKHRADPLVRVMNRLTNVEWRFQSRYFAVLDRSGSRVLWARQQLGGGVESYRLYIRPGLEDCARNLEFPNEIDPDNAAPPCAAR